MLSAAWIEYSASSKQFKSFTPWLKVSLQQFTCFILDFLSFYLLFEMVLHELIISRMLKSTLQLIGELYKLREEGSSLDVCLVGINGKTHVPYTCQCWLLQIHGWVTLLMIVTKSMSLSCQTILLWSWSLLWTDCIVILSVSSTEVNQEVWKT